jgi:large subunit ribosomal protein L29
MEMKEIRSKTDAELHRLLAEARRELLNLRFQLAANQLQNVSRIKQVRRTIARILTELRARNLTREVQQEVR